MAKRKKVYQYRAKRNKPLVFIATYDSVRECSSNTGLNYKTIIGVLNGYKQTTGGYIFSYHKLNTDRKDVE